MSCYKSTVASACFNDETGEYVPEVRSAITQHEIIEFYTNIELPESIEEAYDLIYHSGIIDVVMKHIDKRQIGEINSSINKKVKHIAQSNISSISAKTEDLLSAVDNLQEQFQKLFSEVNSDDMKNMMTSLAKNGLNEKNLVQAYLDTKKSGE